MADTPPQIFSPRRRRAIRARMRNLQLRPDAARFLLDEMTDDVLDRLAFLRHTPATALVIGDVHGTLADALTAQGAAVTRADPVACGAEQAIDEEQPLPFATPFDLIVSLGTLDTVNDLPGALIHLRRALAPDGLAICAFPGAGSLPALRGIMLAADGDRPAPRLHPAVDVRAGGQLLQRAGFADPVVDQQPVRVRYRSLARLLGDVRAMGLSACLERGGPPIDRAGHARARAAFEAAGEVVETFEVLTLSGWAKPLRAPKF